LQRSRNITMKEHDLKHFRILVADDDSSILDLFQQVLSRAESNRTVHLKTGESDGKIFRENALSQSLQLFDVVTCQQGDEAVDAVKDSLECGRPFSIAFIDVRMPPGPDGVWAAEHIRKLDSNIEIVIMTGYSDAHPRDITRRVPPTHKLLYLQKPFHSREIYQFASALSMKWHTERELQRVNKGLEQSVEARIQEFKKVNEELKIKFIELQQTKLALQNSEGKLNAMLLSVPDHISMLDKDLNILWANNTAKEIFGERIIGKKCYEAYHREIKPCEPYPCLTLKAFEDGQMHVHETQVIDKEGNVLCFYCTANVALRDENGSPTAVIEVSRDITEYKQTEEALQKAHDELERRVKDRTKKLNGALKKIHRDKNEMDYHKNSLEKVNKELLETNQALSILARNIDRDKELLEKKIYEITSTNIMPIINELEDDKSCRKRLADLELLKTYLNDLASGPNDHHDIIIALTDQEMRVAVMIKNNLTSQKIADMLYISLHTVKTHRKNIRKKLNIQNSTVNLASYLKSKMVSD